MKEATARIKINKLLEAAGWRFFGDADLPANIRLEPSFSIKSAELDALGENFEKTTKGFIDFLLLDAKGFPLLATRATPSAACCSTPTAPLAAKTASQRSAIPCLMA
ncbi:MAG: hypothetical protein ACKVQK_12195 [Burkholderiales bacterium]